jgi:hypothetical protein
MLESIKTFILIILFAYAIAISVLYWTDFVNKENYQKDKDNQLKYKEDELNKRESIVVDKEICFRELTKLKTVQTSITDILKSYSSLPNDSTKSEEPKHAQ